MSLGKEFGRNIFVLDISGSMSGMKCQTLQLSATRIIEDIPDNSFVGVVLFDTQTKLAHPLIQITERSVRDRVVKSVPAEARGGTDIAKGIFYAVQAFKDSQIATEGATMFLVTDGEDGSGYVDKVLPTLLTAKIRVICIAIGPSADQNLERLSKETQGNTYAASDSNRELAAQVIEATIQEVKPNSTELEIVEIISICDDILVLSENETIKKVIVDCDVGRHTVFTIGSEELDKFDLNIQSPNGRIYDMNSKELTKDSKTKRFQLKLDTTEAGAWSIRLTKNSNNTIRANLTVKSQTINSDAVQMNVSFKEATSQIPPIIIVEICRGMKAVVSADVTATIHKPDGSQTKLVLKNYNKIYCNYFTEYTGNGRYNVTILAQNLKQDTTVPQFERQKIAGSFKITHYMPQRPASDDKLKELSLSSAFNSLKLEEISPRNAVPTSKANVRIDSPKKEKGKTKEDIFELIFVLKKSINSTKITEIERISMKQNIDDIDKRLSRSDKPNETELNNYYKQLQEFICKLK